MLSEHTVYTVHFLYMCIGMLVIVMNDLLFLLFSFVLFSFEGVVRNKYEVDVYYRSVYITIIDDHFSIK